jgi:hypothetical protein
VRTPENTGEDPDDPEPVNKGCIGMDHSYEYNMYSPSIEVTKVIFKNLGQYKYCLIIQNM